MATVAPDGTPAGSPKGTTTVWDDNHLVFADIASPGTVRNLLFERGVHLYAERGLTGAESRIRAIVLIAVTAVESWWSPAYDLGQSEDELREQWWSYWAAMYHPGATESP